MPRRRNEPAEALKRAERDLLGDCLEALRAGATLRVEERERGKRAPAPGPGVCLEVHVEGERILFAAEVRLKLRGEDVGPLVHRALELARRDERLLVCTERVPEPLGERLREHDIAYIDRGGNASLRARGLLVLVTGRPPARARQGRRDQKGTEARMLGLFLIDPKAGENGQVELGKRAGIALGAVRGACDRLVRLGLLEERGKRGWRLRDRALALQRFGEGWAAVIRHRLRPCAYRMLDTAGRGGLEARLEAAGGDLGCLLGGERAAAHLTGFLETEHATLHVPIGQQKGVAQALALVPDRDGPITLLERYGRADEHRIATFPGLALAHPLLVWAECLAVPDERVAQAAQHLHEKLLRGDDE